MGCSDGFNPQLLGMALLGLRGASSSVTEVVAVLSALTPKVSWLDLIGRTSSVNHCLTDFHCGAIGWAMCGQHAAVLAGDEL